jgi:hypothetical protein
VIRVVTVYFLAYANKTRHQPDPQLLAGAMSRILYILNRYNSLIITHDRLLRLGLGITVPAKLEEEAIANVVCLWLSAARASGSILYALILTSVGKILMFFQ